MKAITSHTDQTILKSLIPGYATKLNAKEITALKTKLENASVVNDEELDNKVIRLNSYFVVEEEATKKILRLFLTLPQQQNPIKQKISVFSPLGSALIGFKEGMTVKCALPGGSKKFHILTVIQNDSLENAR